MLGPDCPHLFVGREFTAVGGGPGAGNHLALFGRKDNRLGKIGARKLDHGARDVILIVRGQPTHGLYRFIEEPCHGHKMGLEEVEVEELAVAAESGRLRGLLRPQYRLRVGDVRVFYDLSGVTVEVLAIVPKSEAESWLAQFADPQ